MKDYYEILGVDRSASKEEIKKAYRKIAVENHPDRQQGKSEEDAAKAEEIFKEAAEAYQTLSNDEKRQQYDMFGSDSNSVLQRENSMAEFMKMSAEKKKKEFEMHGTSIRVTIPYTIQDFYSGSTKTIKYARECRCRVCHGTGGSDVTTCPTCGGTGMHVETVRTPLGWQRTMATCHECYGTGTIVKDKCSRCNGTGFEKIEDEVTFDVYSGLMDRMEYALKELGNDSKNPNGIRGNLIIQVREHYDSKYITKNGLDICENVKVDLFDAIAGKTLEIEFPDSTKKSIELKELTPDGKSFKLAGKGAKHPINNDVRGDYYVKVLYKYPEHLDNRIKTAILECRQDKKKDIMNIEVI